MNDFHYSEVSVQHQTSLNKRARNGVGELNSERMQELE